MRSSDDKDEYKRAGVFWVPEGARWQTLASQAKSAGIGELIDDAMDALMKANESLAGVLPKIFNSGTTWISAASANSST